MFRPIALVLALAGATPALADPTVLAAASTGRALDAAIARSGVAALTSYGSSGMLARQIEQGAPADLYLSANPKWMAYLVDAGLVNEADVKVLMSNRLVLIAPEGAGAFDPDAAAAWVAGENFVMADPETAPVGSYGKSALESLGLWEAMADRFVPVRNTLATVAAVASGEAALGLVYASDAADVAGVTVVWDIPETSHPPIRYLIAPVAQGGDTAGAATLEDFLLGPDGAATLGAFGFFTMAEAS